MKKESSDQQQRLLRKLVRYHKPTPAMSAPVARKSTPVVPVGKRTTRSEAAKIRAEKDLHKKVSPTIKFDSKQSEDTSSSESTDSQSEQQKQNTNVPSTKSNDNQSDVNSQQETIEEKSAKKPRKKRISRALFRHDTIDYIKPKKQELLQKTFSLGFKKLVNKSKEIYTKNDDLTNDEELDLEVIETNKETVINEENEIQVPCPMKSPENSLTSNEEKQLNTIMQSKNIQYILDMPSLDSPNSQQSELCPTQVNSLNKMNTENSTRQEHKKSGLKRKEKQKLLEENTLPKNANANDKLSTTAVPRNVCHIQTNSSQKLHYPFYGIIPNKQNTVTSEEQLNNQPTVEDQIPKYKITIVNNPTRVKTNRMSQNFQTNPHQYLIPREVQYKIPSPPKTKPQTIENQIKFPQYPENQMHAMSQMPYPYFHPNYGHPYHLYPYLHPGYQQNFMPQQRQVWNPHVNQINQQNMPRTDRHKLNNLSQEKRQRFSPENTVARQENLQQRNSLINQEKRTRFSTENTVTHQDHLQERNILLNKEKHGGRFLPQHTPENSENLRQRNRNLQLHENVLICHNNLRRNNSTQESVHQEKRIKFSPETTLIRQENSQQISKNEALKNQENLQQRNIVQENVLNPESRLKISPKDITMYQENLRQINSNKKEIRFSPENSTSRREGNTAVEETQTLRNSNQENTINTKKINNLNHEIPIIHQQNTRHTNQNLNEAKNNRQLSCTIVQDHSNHQTQQTENIIRQKQNYENHIGQQKVINYSSKSSDQNLNQSVPSQIINYSKTQSVPFIQNIGPRYQNNNQEIHGIGSQQNTNTAIKKLNVDNIKQCSENTLQGQKRNSSPIKHKINHKRVHFDSNLTDKINLLHTINYVKPDTDGVPIINVTNMPNTLTSQTGKRLVDAMEQKPAPGTKESVIVSPNNRRSIPKTSEQRVIVQINDNVHSDQHNNLHNQNKNNILFMQDKNHTPAEYNNKIIQATCSVIKKVCTEQKNQHTIENILSNKCSIQNKTNIEINNNKNDKINILNIETITLNDVRFNKSITEENSTPRTVIASLEQVLQNPKIKSFECETISNNSTPSKILTRRKTLQHIDLTDDTDQDKNTNSLILQQQLCKSDSISLNDTHTLVVSSNRLTHTQSEYLNTKTERSSQDMAPITGTEEKSVAVTERPMPKLIKVPEEYLNKRSKLETSEKTNEISEKTIDNWSSTSSTIEPRVNVNNYACKNVVPFIKPAHSNTTNKTVETSNLLPLNLSLKNNAQTQDKNEHDDKESDQNNRQSIIVNNKSGSHDPLDLTNLSLIKSEEEYKGYLKLLKEKNATGPYLFYKFVTSVRKRNNQPIFDLITFFSLLKQGKLVEYKNMYNQCNNN